MLKTSLNFKYRYMNEPSSFLFDRHPYIDPERYLYLKVMRKDRKNDIDTKNASPQLLKVGLNQDSMTSVLLGLRHCSFKDETLEEGWAVKLTGEASSDSVNTSIVKLKAQLRNYFSLGNGILLQTTLRA